MITLDDYLYHHLPASTTVGQDIRDNALVIVARANALLDRCGLPEHGITSGYRSPAVNAATPNAAAHSRHMSGQAIDLADPDGLIDNWCFNNPSQLASIGLWQEHPAATKGWCHVQSVPPASGNRVFYP